MIVGGQRSLIIRAGEVHKARIPGRYAAASFQGGNRDGERRAGRRLPESSHQVGRRQNGFADIVAAFP